MAPPPTETDLPAADLWTQITAMPRPHRVVPFPRVGPDGAPIGEIAMFVLSQEESTAAKASALRHVRKLMHDPKMVSVPSELEDLIEMRDSVELLFRACKRVSEPTKPFFPTVDSIGKLTTDEIAVLVLNYRRVQMELGPVVATMGQEEVDAWIDALAKGGSLFPFDSLSLGAQSQLVTTMARRCVSSRTDSSSPTSLPGEPS